MWTLTQARAHGWNLELVAGERGRVDYYWQGPGRRRQGGPYGSALEALSALERLLEAEAVRAVAGRRQP